MELLVKQFVNTGETTALFEWIGFMKQKGLNKLLVLVCELVYPLFSYNIEFLNELGIAYHNIGKYMDSWNVFADILSSSLLTEVRAKQLFFNAHWNISHISNDFIKLPESSKLHKIKFNQNSIPFVTFSITTCKRYDLFEQTINSFINCCEDIDLITHWICVDDNSSEADRIKMKANYPFFKFIWKTPKEKGHAQSMNIILEQVQTPYLFHMEDDWKYFSVSNYIGKCIEVLESDKALGQCLINKNYAETTDDINVLGGIFKTTKFGLRYYEHDFIEDTNLFRQKYGVGASSAYWPHYSLRPGLNRVSTLRRIGTYNPDVAHFEMDFSYRYTEKGYKTAFLDAISCIHIGRLTKDRHDTTKANAYTLNNELQFVDKRPEKVEELDDDIEIEEMVEDDDPNDTFFSNVEFWVVNLDSRPDRFDNFVTAWKNTNLICNRYPAVDGYKLKSTRQLEHLFNFNDYNYRRGMIGCALSHIDIWTSCEKQKKTVVVFEDDATFVPRFYSKLKHVLSTTPQDYDIIFLGHHLFESRVESDTFDKNIFSDVERWSVGKSLCYSKGGTAGYVITPLGARKMLQFIQDNGMTNGIDTMMQKACDELNIYYCKTHLVYSECYSSTNMDTVDTDIQRNYDSMRRSLKERQQAEADFFKDRDIIRTNMRKGDKFRQPKENEILYFLADYDGEKPTKMTYHIEHIGVLVHEDIIVIYKLEIGLLDKYDQFSTKNLLCY
jgi:GR25 family glycosyltransferase involved in LPS biosynthesis/GT2 family glycosyltransferase